MIRNSLVIRIGMCPAAAAAMSVLTTAPAATVTFFFSTGTPRRKYRHAFTAGEARAA